MAGPLLRMRGIAKSFPGVRALAGVDLELDRGEVLALMGENGAGKSTLIKVLTGAVVPDSGEIEIEGRRAAIRSPLDARRAGVAAMYQEFNLVPALTARENIFLGRERRGGWIDAAGERKRAAELFGRVGVAVDPETPCGRLSVAQQQVVEIAKSLALDARILVMDEPSAALTPQEVSRLLDIVRDLRKQGLGIVYVSHRLEEVFALADRIMVMRDGARVDARPAKELPREKLIELMVGRPLDSEFPRRTASPGPARLVARDLRGGRVRGVSFEIRRGEILGLTGLVGAGRTETARLLFGADPLEGGSVELDGRALRIRSPRDAIREGICLLTEDRKRQGLVLGHAVRENFGLPNLGRLTRLGFVRGAAERGAFAGWIGSLRIKVPHQEERAGNLSGGNQQKVILAKWLERNGEILLFDEPTRGIDVGAKREIYDLMNRLTEQGKSILMISSELPEVLGMSDRILVMRDGRLTGEIREPARATQEEILRLAVA